MKKVSILLLLLLLNLKSYSLKWKKKNLEKKKEINFSAKNQKKSNIFFRNQIH